MSYKNGIEYIYKINNKKLVVTLFEHYWQFIKKIFIKKLVEI